MMNIQTT